MSLAPAERFARLRLARTERIGPVAFDQLLKRYGSAQGALDALPGLVRRAGGPSVPPPVQAIEAEMAAGQQIGAQLIVRGDDAYPPMLAAVDPPPPVLWTLGDAGLLSRPSPVAVVGARVASAGGQRIARGLAQQLGQAGHVIVSGLARGIDTAAHEGSLPTGTVAVLGGGIDDVYPPDNAGLYDRIRAEGCIVSESPVGARAQARDFPRRNRIISGLSRGVIVVEAEIRSGSLITARLAAEQGRDVFAVPGSPLDPRSRGPNELIRNGAILCEGLEDVERAFSTLRTLREPAVDDPFRDAPSEIEPQLLDRVAALLSPTPTPRDELARALNLPVAVVAAALLELDLSGRATLLPGGLASL
ncbi:MAG TPA: DNA-processing protein DprA [Brevundimonas sp.]|uniref:DNA-processing protein DprA n=1 Tax=Brevundimonas sp. TaxID=1871086 RepID=UPI00262F1102|nr:DNA-processing protein DprA [Brevundimonas sp.]HRO33571.1 DNA-processing protein DprA [Brevundimonas sp.]